MVAFFDAADAEVACLGAADARAFLKANGLNTEESIEIHIVKRLPNRRTVHAFGCFSRELGQVHILSYSVCRDAANSRAIFGLPWDQRLYRSLVAHEIAHAVASRNFAMKQPLWVAQEYIAYVTQLATMPRDLRERIMMRFSQKGFETPAEINPYILMLSPEVFAVKAYRHFVRKENGAAFFRALLDGESLVDQEFSP